MCLSCGGCLLTYVLIGLRDRIGWLGSRSGNRWKLFTLLSAELGDILLKRRVFGVGNFILYLGKNVGSAGRFYHTVCVRKNRMYNTAAKEKSGLGLSWHRRMAGF